MDLFALKNYSEIIDGWILNFKEVSNNVYTFELTDKFGRKSGCTDHDFERGLETCVSYAFDIEKQINKNWNKFLLDIFKLKLSSQKLTEEVYHEKTFGSWTIQLNNFRIILDGKDYILALQSHDKNKIWTDKENIKLEELTFDKIRSITSLLENQTDK
jgi:hypothetical protein